MVFLEELFSLLGDSALPFNLLGLKLDVELGFQRPEDFTKFKTPRCCPYRHLSYLDPLGQLLHKFYLRCHQFLIETRFYR